jgi:molybdopterin-containing oxidoreductase family membrane subunit
VADLDQPLRRGHDAVRGGLRGFYPIFHTGRPWLALLALPVPEHDGPVAELPQPAHLGRLRGLTYATVSALFWFVGLIPDLATLRDRARSKPWKVVYGILAMGWRGSAKHWHNYETAYLLLAGLATPLVVSVHTVVSFDFAVGSCPAGTPRSSRPTSWRARSTRASRWC